MSRFLTTPQPVTFLRRALRSLALALGFVAVLAPRPVMAQAQGGKGLSIIRDTEIEQLLRDYSGPIFRAAGVNASQTDIVLIQDRSFNAFVANGRRIFMNVGILMDAETPNEVIGVIAHETGHIAGGHLARLRQEISNAQIIAAIGMIAGAGAAVGAATSRDRGSNAGIGAMGVFGGGAEIARRSLLAYQRSEEQAADRAAVRFLDATGQSSRGMLRTFARFAESGMFSSRAVDPYQISHPLPQERIAQLQTLAEASPNFEKRDAAALQTRHNLARAKLYGFLERFDGISRRYPGHDMSTPARYARAIAAHRSGRLQEALGGIETLLREQPGNPYFHELRGQVLLESGQARAAIEPLQRAARAAPTSGLIRGMLGHALLAAGNPVSLDQAIRELSYSAEREKELPDPHRHLASAYARKGNVGMAELSAAQAAFLEGDLVTAQTQATRAKQKLPAGSPGALRADDIVNFRPPRS
ncbi:MAG: M48 family metalloprotease [Hyphomicrobiales bacterium]|nr:M48 family metalloprotease [Hyphomicrobiales bacterium]